MPNWHPNGEGMECPRGRADARDVVWGDGAGVLGIVGENESVEGREADEGANAIVLDRHKPAGCERLDPCGANCGVEVGAAAVASEEEDTDEGSKRPLVRNPTFVDRKVTRLQGANPRNPKRGGQVLLLVPGRLQALPDVAQVGYCVASYR
jgi:hypothetical protein